MASDPEGFPWQFAGMTVRFGKTMWNVDPLGYQPDHPLFEVLCEIGAICDPSGWWSHTTQDAQADFYVVTFLRSEWRFRRTLNRGVREVPKPNGHRNLHVIFEWMTAHSFGCSARS